MLAQTPRFAGTPESLTLELAGRDVRLVLERRGPNGAPLWLLLPALSTISSRSEWRDFADVIGDRCQLVSFDWPGFGDSDRPDIPYDASLLCSALRSVLHHLQRTHQGRINVLAVGHSASVALGLAAECSDQWQQLVLVAPTWRGPLPTMTGWTSGTFRWLRMLVKTPLLGSALYRLNTSKAVLKLMIRRHVWVDANLLTPERLSQQQQLTRRSGARFASVAFVSGALDPADHRNWWLQQVRKLRCSLHVVLATEAPPRSKQEMELLATLAQQVSTINGRLGLHEEFATVLAEQILHS